MIPSPEQLCALAQALWAYDALDETPVARVIRDTPSLAWLVEVEGLTLNLSLSISGWFLVTTKDVFVFKTGSSFDARFLTDLCRTFRGEKGVSLDRVHAAMESRWVATKAQIYGLLSRVAPILAEKALVSKRERFRWFSIQDRGGIHDRVDDFRFRVNFGFSFGAIDFDTHLSLTSRESTKVHADRVHADRVHADRVHADTSETKAKNIHEGWAATYARETPPEKAKVNDEIVEALEEMGVRQEATALLLDAEQAFSSRTLIDFGIAPCRIHVPNPDKDICVSLSELGVTALPVPLKALLLDPEGLGTDLDVVFQDTCATLKGNAVYSPKDDAALLFRRRLFAHRALYVLEISGRAPDSVVDKGVDEEALEYIQALAETYGYSITKERHYSYKNTLSNGKRGGLMWVFFFWLKDALSTMARKEAYAKGLLEWLVRRSPGSLFRVYKPRALRVAIQSSSPPTKPKTRKRSGGGEKPGYKASVFFPTMTCKQRIKEWVIPDLANPTHAYCAGCDDSKGGHKPVCLPASFDKLLGSLFGDSVQSFKTKKI
jgi:hypothetical protein